MSRFKSLLPLAVATAAATAPPAVQALDIFMKTDPEIQGESTVIGHENDIIVLSWSWGTSRTINITGSGGSTASQPNFQDISIIKDLDRASAKILEAIPMGAKFNTIDIYVRVPNTSPPAQITDIKMTDALFTSAQSGATSGSSEFSESVSIGFTCITITTFSTDLAGKTTQTGVVGYDRATNQPTTSCK